MKKQNIIASVVGIFISLGAFFKALTFPEDQVMNIGPAFFPMVLAALLFIFSVALGVKSFAFESGEECEKIDIKDPGIRRALIFLGISLAYTIILPFAGFPLLTMIFLFILMLILRMNNYLLMTVISAGVTFTVFFIFQSLLNITLPLGVLEYFF